MTGETIRIAIGLRLDVDFVHVMYIKDKQMLVFSFVFDCGLWTARGSSVSSVASEGSVSCKTLRSMDLG